MSNADEPRNLRSDSMSAMATPLQLIACLVHPHTKYNTLRAACNMHHTIHRTAHTTTCNTQLAACGDVRRTAACACLRAQACVGVRACIASAQIFGVTVRERVLVCVCMCVRACVRACVRVCECKTSVLF